jgi:hypothetical protein
MHIRPAAPDIAGQFAWSLELAVLASWLLEAGKRCLKHFETLET